MVRKINWRLGFDVVNFSHNITKFDSHYSPRHYTIMVDLLDIETDNTITCIPIIRHILSKIHPIFKTRAYKDVFRSAMDAYIDDSYTSYLTDTIQIRLNSISDHTKRSVGADSPFDNVTLQLFNTKDGSEVMERLIISFTMNNSSIAYMGDEVDSNLNKLSMKYKLSNNK